MPETSFTAGLMAMGPLSMTFAVGFAAWTALMLPLGVVIGRAAKLGETQADRDAEFNEAKGAYLEALVRGDTRAQKRALDDLMDAKHSTLAGEIGWRGKR